ncbi:hypothetical protein [Porphyromonas sp. COT-239 OH1446]|uniref:hypothetical protein n=1 Tax=Porphyromonas sp. COT-239 OH1446 TaxID=1515613 RepID=UPI001363BB0F|nr:hypothetical protein [Porphyromonas sp. COT-239 OH1446]
MRINKMTDERTLRCAGQVRLGSPSLRDRSPIRSPASLSRDSSVGYRRGSGGSGG